ncbi:MAG: TonB-dependent receptor plug domain-containing protein [Candidatus Cryptobacteroides sp.]
MHFLALLAILSLNVPQQDTLAAARSSAARELSFNSAVPVLYMGKEQLQNTPAQSLSEALRGFSALSIKDYGGLGGLKTVSIRNFGAQHSCLVLDGICLSDAMNGQVDLGRYSLDDIAFIKVEIAGSNDIFCSARQLSGVGAVSINVAPPVFEENRKFGAGALLSAGSFGTLKSGLEFKCRLFPKWSASGSLSYLSSEGNYPFSIRNGTQTQEQLRLNSDISALNAQLRVFGTLPRGSLRLCGTWYDSSRGLPGSVILYTQHPSERLWDKDLFLSALYEGPARLNGQMRLSASWTSKWNRYTNSDPKYATPLDDYYLQNEAAFSGVLLYHPWSIFSLSFAEDIICNALESNIPNCIWPWRLLSYSAVSAKLQTSSFSLTASVLATLMYEMSDRGEAADPFAGLSPSLSLSYAINDNFSLRASSKQSLRLPTFNDLYYPRTGNRDLAPERAWQNNLGLSWNAGNIGASADVFYNLVKDKIVAVPTMFIWSMRNVGKVQMLGCDLSLHWQGRPLEWLGLRADINYSFNRAVDLTDPSAKNYGHQIAYTPRHSAGAGLQFELPFCRLSYSLSAVGERYSLAQNTPAYRMDPYADHSLSISREFSFGRFCRLQLSADALNISNINYEIIQYYPMPGRNYRLTLKLSY